jgi:hypothetical protein
MAQPGQSIPRSTRRPGRHDIWLEWPATYRPPCPVCAQPTIGLMDHGHYVGRPSPTLRIQTTAEPCGCDVTDQAQALQIAAVRAGAIR